MRLSLVLVVLVTAAPAVRAGLYYSAEKYATLPAQWRGFLLDQRMLRNIAVAPGPGADTSPMRRTYLDEVHKLRQRAEEEKLSADDSADLGALLIRLGETTQALEVLRAAHKEHPTHFQLAANLGTAWQLLGELERALDCLRQAVELAPGKDLPFEEAHLRLVQLRLRQRQKQGELDDLFGVRYVGPGGSYEAGKLAEAERKKLPTRAVAVVQQLALWLPADGPLLWQLAELASAHGDLRSGAAMLDGCVIQFGMQHPVLREHRRLLREAADALPKLEPGARGEHEPGHAGSLAFRSRRPLLNRLDLLPLPAISETGVNSVPWELFAETQVEQPFKATFPKYLRELEGKSVELAGFLVPVRDEPDADVFMVVEAPVGCWYCEMPEVTGIVYAELPRGRTARYQRGLVRVVGRLRLNDTDAEDFLYTLRDARIGLLD
jgi:tetratricopeptide (TPR) repeat protein